MFAVYVIVYQSAQLSDPSPVGDDSDIKRRTKAGEDRLAELLTAVFFVRFLYLNENECVICLLFKCQHTTTVSLSSLF